MADLGVGAAVLLDLPLRVPRELAQRREVLHLLARARVAVDDHVLADDLAALDLRADLGQRERPEVEAVLLDQPALLRVVDGAARDLGDVERTPERASAAVRRRGGVLLRGLRPAPARRRPRAAACCAWRAPGPAALRTRLRLDRRLRLGRAALALRLRRERGRVPLGRARGAGGRRRPDGGDAARDARLQVRQRLPQLHRRMEARLRIARQRLRDHPVDAGRRVGAVAGDPQRRRRQPPGQHLVEDDAQRVDVRRQRRRSARQQLGRQVSVLRARRSGRPAAPASAACAPARGRRP